VYGKGDLREGSEKEKGEEGSREGGGKKGGQKCSYTGGENVWAGERVGIGGVGGQTR